MHRIERMDNRPASSLFVEVRRQRSCGRPGEGGSSGSNIFVNEWGMTMDPKFEKRKAVLCDCKNLASSIINDLKLEDVRKQLNTICRIEELPDLATDCDMKEMKDYVEVREILKKTYIEVARALMAILSAEDAYSADQKTSFNYSEPLEPMLAAEYIKLLPKAYIAGPMKAAVRNPHAKVRRIAIEYYDSLPSDLRYSGLFPVDFNKTIAKLKASHPA